MLLKTRQHRRRLCVLCVFVSVKMCYLCIMSARYRVVSTLVVVDECTTYKHHSTTSTSLNAHEDGVDGDDET